MTLPVELETSVNQLRLKHTALIDAVNNYRTGTIDISKQELLDMADKLVGQLEIEEHTLLGQIARKAKLHPRVLQGLREGPGLLFLKGEQGVWYDPSDLSTLFQDAAGTTPVTADGDPGGLMLDKSRGLELGPNLADTFDLSAFHVLSRVQNVSADSFEVADGETDGGVAGRLGVSGKRYTAVVHYTRLTPGDIALTVGSVSTAAEQVRETMATSGTITATRSADTANTLFIRLYGAGASVRIDAIELREVKGNTATQPISASRPVYETDGTLFFDGVDDALIVLDNAPQSTPYASIGNYCSGFFAVRFLAFGSPNTQPNWVASSVIHEIRNTGTSNVKIPFSFGVNGDLISFGCASDYTRASSRYSGATNLVPNQPYVIGFVVNGDSVTLYLNGVIEGVFTGLGTASRSPSDGTGPVSSRIGARTTDVNGATSNFSGSIAAAVITDYALTAAQVENVTAYLANKAGVTL